MVDSLYIRLFPYRVVRTFQTRDYGGDPLRNLYRETNVEHMICMPLVADWSRSAWLDAPTDAALYVRAVAYSCACTVQHLGADVYKFWPLMNGRELDYYMHSYYVEKRERVTYEPL